MKVQAKAVHQSVRELAADELYLFLVRLLAPVSNLMFEKLTRLARLYWHSVVFVPLQQDGLALEELLWWQ